MIDGLDSSFMKSKQFILSRQISFVLSLEARGELGLNLDFFFYSSIFLY